MLETFFTPKSVAVIGASATPGKLGHAVVRNLQEGGFEGEIYPINPKSTEILG
ncbi:MAG: CoA-binding protein, partial [Anaerolineae bacterium]|nr:CoA-binding protein [Anaerolineae bacterium]